MPNAFDRSINMAIGKQIIVFGLSVFVLRDNKGTMTLYKKSVYIIIWQNNNHKLHIR